MKRYTGRYLKALVVLAVTFWLAHEIAPDHSHDLSAYADTAQYVINLAGGELAEVHSTDCYQQVTVHDRNWTDVVCGASWTPTPFPPTAVPPTPTQAPTEPEAIQGVLLCTDHDPTKWHPLVKRDAANTILCTYGHEHHADPNSLNDIFGQPGAWYGGTQAISYPWQTSGAAGPENVAKHEGYKWYVARDIPCIPAQPKFDTTCVVSYRAEVHTLGTAADQVVRFHSFSVEALVNDNGKLGIIRHGGHMDTGHMRLTVRDPSTGGIVPICLPAGTLPADDACGGNGPAREVSSANVPAPYTANHLVPNAPWYAHGDFTNVTPRLEEFGPVDYTDPHNQLLYPVPTPGRGTTFNNSVGSIGTLNFAMQTAKFLKPFTDAQGIVTMSEYANNTGSALVTGCTAASPTCFPLVIEHVSNKGAYWMTSDRFPDPFGATNDFDVPSPSTGRSLIRFPN